MGLTLNQGQVASAYATLSCAPRHHHLWRTCGRFLTVSGTPLPTTKLLDISTLLLSGPQSEFVVTVFLIVQSTVVMFLAIMVENQDRKYKDSGNYTGTWQPLIKAIVIIYPLITLFIMLVQALVRRGSQYWGGQGQGQYSSVGGRSGLNVHPVLRCRLRASRPASVGCVKYHGETTGLRSRESKLGVLKQCTLLSCPSGPAPPELAGPMSFEVSKC